MEFRFPCDFIIGSYLYTIRDAIELDVILIVFSYRHYVSMREIRQIYRKYRSIFYSYDILSYLHTNGSFLS